MSQNKAHDTDDKTASNPHQTASNSGIHPPWRLCVAPMLDWTDYIKKPLIINKLIFNLLVL